MVIFVLAVIILFELGFAWDTFKKLNGAKQALNVAMQMNFQYADRILRLESENKAAMTDLSDVRELLKSKIAEDNYLRELLDEHGIEWEAAWRKLS